MIITTIDAETEWLLKALSHKIRRKILKLIQDYSFLKYSDLLRELSLSTGKLNFHLRQLTNLIEKDKDGIYRLTERGKTALEILEKIGSISEKGGKEHFDFENLKLKELKPAEETKTKLYLEILVNFVIFLFLPQLIANIVLRKTIYILIFTVGISLLYILSIFLAKKYLDSISYELFDTEIVIRKGIITQSKSTIPYRTITNMIIKRGPFDRLFNISTIIIQTAGESATERPEGKIIGAYYPDELLEEIMNLVRLLDPPAYIKERVTLSLTPKSMNLLYSRILDELKNIKQKLEKTERKEANE